MDAEKKPEIPAWLMAHISELSQTARTIHTVYVGFLIYCLLTILSTSNRKLALDEAVHLPIINVDVSFSGFVVVGPLVGIFAYIYFQLHLQVLKRAISRVRDNYGKEEREKVFPWMITLNVKQEGSAVGEIHERLVKISLWWLLPVVLFLFTILTLKTHIASLIVFEHFAFLIGLILVCCFRVNYDRFADDAKELPPTNLEVIAFVITFALAYVYLWGMMIDDNAGRARYFHLDLSGQRLVEKQESEDENLYWHDFRGKHFEGANLSNTFLKLADLQRAHLEKVHLENADMQGANLGGADLSHAVLYQVKLGHAHFRDADLTGAVLSCIDISETDFTEAKLSQAVFINTNLCENKSLKAAQLSEASIIYNSDPKNACEEQIKRGEIYTPDELTKNYPDVIVHIGPLPTKLSFQPDTEEEKVLSVRVYYVLNGDYVSVERWTDIEAAGRKDVYREELVRYPASCLTAKH